MQKLAQIQRSQRILPPHRRLLHNLPRALSPTGLQRKMMSGGMVLVKSASVVGGRRRRSSNRCKLKRIGMSYMTLLDQPMWKSI
jgi:hypothetical protein